MQQSGNLMARVAMVTAVLLIVAACGPSDEERELQRLHEELARYEALAAMAGRDADKHQALMSELDAFYSYVLSQEHFYQSDLREVPSAMVDYDKEGCLKGALAKSQILSCISKVKKVLGSELFEKLRVATDANDLW